MLPLWLVVSLGLSYEATLAVLYTLHFMGVSFVGINSVVFDAMAAAAIYLFALAFAIGLPWLFKKYTTREELGATRLPSWGDIGLAPVAFIVYFLASALLVYVASQIIPGFDVSQVQYVGFSRLSRSYEYVLAFTTLIVIAPVAEELLFRGFLYGKLRQRLPIWLAAVVTSLVFGFVHGQWNVGVDVFALSLVLCSLREITGNIWAGMLLHMLKNSVAFFMIFIVPML